MISKAKPGQNASINSENEFMDKLEKKQKEWMKDALTSARKNWQSHHPKFNEITRVPQFLYELVTESLNDASAISKDLAEKVLIESLQNVINFIQDYHEAIIDFKMIFFQDRSRLESGSFTNIMMAIMNSLEEYEILVDDLKIISYMKLTKDMEFSSSKFEQILYIIVSLRADNANILIDEMFLDIDPQFEKIMTSNWEFETEAIDILIPTVADYFLDYKKFADRDQELISTICYERLAIRYIYSLVKPSKNVLTSRITIKDQQQCEDLAQKISKEVEQIKCFFRKVRGEITNFDVYFRIIDSLLVELRNPAAKVNLKNYKYVDKYMAALVEANPDLSHDIDLCILKIEDHKVR